ncbi:MAG: H-X9-DG-CTERM domain-containing protein [Armatimonadota bacterium]
MLPLILVLATCAALLIAVAAAMPFLGREKARLATCRANEKSLATATLMYAADHSGVLPPSARWDDAILPYAKNSNVFICPSAGNRGNWPPGYAFNSHLDDVREVSAMPVPAVCPILWDSTTLVANAADGGTSLAMRHRGGANVAFADGQVKWLDSAARLTFDPMSAERDDAADAPSR